MTHLRSRSRRLRGEQGFTIVELLFAVTLMAVGIAATVKVYGSSDRTALAAQRAGVAAQQAQGELDRLSKLSYDKLGLTSTPATSTDAFNPGSRVSGTTFTVRSGFTESFVLSSDTGQSGASVSPSPTPFSVGVSGETVSGNIYRYVTWRDEVCASGCAGTKDTKRITVAVTIDASGTLSARAPVFLSQVIPDPNAIAPGNSVPSSSGGGSSSVTAQDFYLYDTRCGSSTRLAQSGDHSTHASAASGGGSTYSSFCENTNLSNQLQPDLMGDELPPGDNSTPLYNYSSDVSGVYDGGLAMKRQGTTCRSSFDITNALSTAQPNMWSVHGWSTTSFAKPFNLDGVVTISMFTTTMGGAAGRGVVCATLLDRTLVSGAPSDTTIGSTTYDLAAWPTDTRRISFSFDIGTFTIPINHRLVLALSVRSESANDLVFLYDHPLYPSFLEVATTTPL